MVDVKVLLLSQEDYFKNQIIRHSLYFRVTNILNFFIEVYTSLFMLKPQGVLNLSTSTSDFQVEHFRDPNK